jgi:hypothetical protein
MSICYICQGRGWTVTNAGGICVECSSYVCRMPSSRADNVVHAYQCACGGRHFVCEVDAIRHSQGHGTTILPSPCFPDLTFNVAPPAGEAASTLLSGIATDRPDDYQAISRLLRVVAPGGMALYRATAIQGSIFEPVAGEFRIEHLEPKADFYSEGRLTKILALAARMTAEAVRLPAVGGKRRQEVLQKLFGNEQLKIDVRSISDALLGRWAPTGIVVADPLAIPTESAALARWLLEDERERDALENFDSVSESAASRAYAG